MAERSDHDLFLAVASLRRDGSADELWSRHAPRLLAYARTVLIRSHDQDLAEDVVQQVFVSILRMGRRRARSVRSVEAWLITATRSAALNTTRGEQRERRRRWRRAYREPGTGPVSMHESLRELVEALPPDEAEVVTLRHAYGLSYEAIGELVGAAKSTVASRHARALDRLRNQLERDRSAALGPGPVGEVRHA